MRYKGEFAIEYDCKSIKPRCFDLMVDVAKKMSIDKDQPSLNIGKTISCLLTNVSKSKYCAALTGDLEA